MRKLFAIIVFLALIALPFFWLKPGEMDLGGDSSRLYFYDPLSYLKNHTLYAAGPSGFGAEVVGFWGVPFIMLLFFLKYIFFSSTLLINIDHGLNLSLAFLACYLTVRELCRFNDSRKNNDKNTKMHIEIASVIAGLFYTLAPGLIYGWDKVTMIHSQFFLNPLIFFLLLIYMKSGKFNILMGIVLITFIFAQNFSLSAIAPVLAFYPASALFIIIYTKKILRREVNWRYIILTAGIFFGIHSFHLFPQIIYTFSPGSSTYDAAFTPQGMYVRGLSYFTSIAREIKVSIHLMNLPQQTLLRDFMWLFIIFPVITLLGFFWNRSKTTLLTALFFLFLFFMVTANITGVFFELYKLLFRIPGFAMFRNYYGQWQYAFIFFYAILFGQSFFQILQKLQRKTISITLSLILIGILIYGSWPLLDGSNVNKVLYQSKKKIAMTMDPSYEETLKYIRDLPIDGKILTLPLADPGYQVLAGTNDGAYQGPSTISYLAGKRDFAGYDDLNIEGFSDTLLSLARNNNYKGFSNMLSLLNVKYIFHNADTKIYDDTFPQFPYSHVRESMPSSQKEYQDFLAQLPVRKINQFGGKYNIYKVLDNNTNYLPHIYIPKKIVLYNNRTALDWLLSNQSGEAMSFLKVDDTIDIVRNTNNKHILNSSETILAADNTNPLFNLIDNSHLHEHQPFVSNSVSSLFYPFILLREKYDLRKKESIPGDYVDQSLYVLSKRIFELTNEGIVLPISYKPVTTSSNILKMFIPGRYNSWEASFKNYEDQETTLINWINNSSQPDHWKIAMKIKISEQIYFHKKRLQEFLKIMKGNKTEEDRKYLAKKIEKLFEESLNRLHLSYFDPQITFYGMDIKNGIGGDYEVYLENNAVYKDQSRLFLDIDGNTIKPVDFEDDKNLIRFNKLAIDDTKKKMSIVFHIPFFNLIANTNWQAEGGLETPEKVKNLDTADEAVRIFFSNIINGRLNGYTREINDWVPKNQYLVTFDYKTNGDDFSFKIYEKLREKSFDEKTYTFKTSIATKVAYERNINSQEWQTFQTALSANLVSEKAALNIVSLSEKTTSALEIKNLSVVQIPYSKLIFKKNYLAKSNVVFPEIIFTKINPTKYKIDVKGVKEPYELVFLDAFNKNWKLIDVNTRTESFRGGASRFAGYVGKTIVSLFTRDHRKQNNIVANYFDGTVKEAANANMFLESDTFETWGKEVIVKNNHFQSNGYANTWIILPEDISRPDYTLTLELTREKKFYFFLGVSIFTFISILLYMLLRFIKR